MREWINLFESADIAELTHSLRDRLCRENNKTPQQMNSGQCDEFADALEGEDPRFESMELGNLYNHTTGDCDDATGFDVEMIHRINPHWQPPADFTWEQAFDECGLSWTGTHIWAFCSANGLSYDIENVDGVANVFDLEFFKRIFAHYRAARNGAK